MSENPNGTGRGRQVGDPFVPEEPTQAVRDFFGPAFSDVAEYARMLEEEGELRGLLGPRDMERIWSRHIVNSAAVLDFMPRKEGREVLDVGSGSGLPGIVIAACRPDLHIHLAEPMERRVEWLEEVVEGLGLDNVTVHQARADELAHIRHGASSDHVGLALASQLLSTRRGEYEQARAHDVQAHRAGWFARSAQGASRSN